MTRSVLRAALASLVVVALGGCGDDHSPGSSTGKDGSGVGGSSGAGAGAGGNGSGGTGGDGGTGGSGGPGAGVTVPPCDPSEHHSQALFAAPDGLPEAEGTLSSPTSLEAALGRLEAGMTLYLLAGVYEPSSGITLSTSGTAETPTTMKAYQCQEAILDCSACGEDGAFLSVWGSHVVVEDLVFRNSRAWTGITAYRPHVTFRRNVVHGMHRTGISAYRYGDNPDPEHVLIEGNEVYGNVLHNEAGTATHGWNNAIAASYAHATVRGNVVHDNHGEGIVVGGPGPVLVEGNVVYDNFSTQIYVANSQHATVRGNLLYYTGKTNLLMKAFDDLPPAGILVANENENGPSLQGGNAVIVNNIVVGTRHGFAYLGFQAGGGLRSSLVAGNTFYGALAEVLRIDADDHEGSQVIGNVFVQTDGKPLTAVSGVSGVTFASNAFFGGDAGGAASPTDVTADPSLKSPGAFDPEGYRPTADSPLLAKGTALSELTHDFFGSTRTNPPDLGALQH